jgi:biotin transport system substrate-specific component
VFAGGASTMALVGPSAGFLIGFLPAAVVTSLLKGKARVDSPKHAALTAARYLSACVAGCIVLDYLLGFIVQSAITGVTMPVVAIASMGFIVGDCIKAVVASLVASGLAKLQ